MNIRFVVFIVFCAVASHIVPAAAVDFLGKSAGTVKGGTIKGALNN